MNIILETDRLLLREFVLEDAEALLPLVTDLDITRYTGDGCPTATLDYLRERMKERTLADYHRHGFGRWATVDRSTGQIIGFAGLKYLDDIAAVDLGYRFLKVYWGKGLATEASHAVVRHGFDRLGLDEIIGIVHRENAASIRVLEKVGFGFDRFTTYQDFPVAWYTARK